MNRISYGLLVVITTALMGSGFAVGKIGLDYSSPILLVALRFSMAGLIMAIMVMLMKRKHPNNVTDWFRIVIIGFFQTAGVMGCIFVGLRTVSAGELSILTFTNPLLVVALGTIFLKTRYQAGQWLGVFLGFVGVYVTLGANLDFKEGTILGILSAISWAIGTLLIKVWGLRFDIWVLTAYQMLFGGIILYILSLLTEKPFFIVDFNSIFVLLWLTIMCSVVQFAGWFYLINKGDSGKVSAFLFFAPFFGVLFGWILLNEQLSLNVLFGGLLIFVGIFLVNWKVNLNKSKDRPKLAKAN